MKRSAIVIGLVVCVTLGVVWIFKGCQTSPPVTNATSQYLANARPESATIDMAPRVMKSNISPYGSRAQGAGANDLSGTISGSGAGKQGAGTVTLGGGALQFSASNFRGAADTFDSVTYPSFAGGFPELGSREYRTDPSTELWIISRPPQDRIVPHSDVSTPGEGQLEAKRNEAGGEKLVPVPLKHTDVKASVIGYIASVDVQQQYQNPYSEKIEAVYVFPLPQNAAVNEFIMTIGQRRIRGIIRERHEAEQIYQQARSQGYVASLLTQERPNVFTQAVANIEPGKLIDIDIKYFNTLSYVDGSYEFVFPMVVGPRFNPPGYYDGIGAVPRGKDGVSRQKTEVQYLAPNERSGHDISLTVDINAGVPIDKLDSRNHKIAVTQNSPSHASVTLDSADNIPNRDFVLRYKVAGASVKPALIAQNRGGGGGFFTLMLFPPELLKDLPRQPLEFVFTIDVSGSQNGRPLEQEKAATRYALTHMGPDDTFQVVRFGNTARTFFPTPQPVTPTNMRRALQWVDGFDANEGTMLIEGVHASLLFPHDQSRTRYVAFMTDGFIGNDAEAIAEVHKCLGPARLFSFGVGQSTNRYLLDGMARMGRGAVAYLGLNDDANEVMAQYFERISHPALSDIRIDWGGGKTRDVFPAQVPDLYVGRPVVLTGRYEGELPKSVFVCATVQGREERIEVPVQAADTTVDAKALPAVWARAKISDLADRAMIEGGIDLPGQTRQLALEYNLISSYTAFVAVDSTIRTAGDFGVTVGVPVPVPEGVRYETTVQQSNLAKHQLQD
jgi:Ca-activated chloride channel family protein